MTPYSEKPNLYAERHYWQTNISRGVVRTKNGARVCALTSDFLLGLHRAITHECGAAAEEVFKKCGRKWGQQVAQRFSAELAAHYGASCSEFSMALFETCLQQAFSHHGWGLLTLDLTHYEQGLIVAQLENAIYASLLQQSDRAADGLMTGLLAGFFAELSGEPLDCVQTDCPTRGGQQSRFIIGLENRLRMIQPLLKQGRPHETVLAELAKIRSKS